MGRWNGFDNVKVPDNPGTGDGSGEVPKEVLDHVKNTDIHIDSLDQKNKIITKDIVFNVLGPLKVGVINETEFLAPLKGTITNISASISLDSNITSNLILGVQKYINDNWILVENINMQVYDKGIFMDTSIDVNNNILRIILVEGDFANVKNLNIIMKLKEE